MNLAADSASVYSDPPPATKSSKQPKKAAPTLLEKAEKLAKEQAAANHDSHNDNINIIPPTVPKRKGPGRPPKQPTTTPPTTPTRSQTPPPQQPPPAEDAASVKIERQRRYLLKKIFQLCEIYPHLVINRIIPPIGYLENLELSVLQEYFKLAKESKTLISDYSEYKVVSTIFIGALKHFESLCMLLDTFVSSPSFGFADSPIALMLRLVAKSPPGTFASFIQQCIDQGDEISTDLKEIAVDFIGYLPENPYGRLAMHLAYKMYDYTIFASSSRVRNAYESLRDDALFEAAASRAASSEPSMAAQRRKKVFQNNNNA